MNQLTEYEIRYNHFRHNHGTHLQIDDDSTNISSQSSIYVVNLNTYNSIYVYIYIYCKDDKRNNLLHPRHTLDRIYPTNMFLDLPLYDAQNFVMCAPGYNIPRGPFYWHGLTLIPAWISYHMPGKVWDEITYSFLNFNGATVKVGEWISNFTNTI